MQRLPKLSFYIIDVLLDIVSCPMSQTVKGLFSRSIERCSRPSYNTEALIVMRDKCNNTITVVIM
jgi:hypothetical protein